MKEEIESQKFMEEFSIQNYLAKWKARSSVSHALLALGAFLAGAVVLFLTFWFTYAILWFAWHGVSAASDLAFGKRLPLSHAGRLIGSGIFLALLFVQYFRTSPWHWGDYPRRDYPAHPALQPQSGAGSMVWLLAHPGASANMIADILLCGPRLVVGAGRLAVKSFRIARLDPEACARLLAFLLTSNGAVAYAELRAAGWEPWFAQLRCLDGVHFFEKGLSLSDELKQELGH